MSKSNQNRTNINKGKIFTFDFVMNWSFKQPTCSKRLMESWSTFLSKRSSSGDLNAAPSLDPYSAAKLLNNKRRNSFSCVRYFCYRRNWNEVKNVKEGHWCHLHNTKNSQKQTSRQFEHWVIKTRALVLYVGCLNGQTKLEEDETLPPVHPH